MASEISIKMRKITRKSGTTLVMDVVTVDKPPKQLLRNQREYQRKFDGLLASAGDFDRLDIIINSPGGVATSGMGLMGAVVQNLRRRWRHFEDHIRILIDGQCSSAATAMLGICAPVYITPGGRVYIHSNKIVTYKGHGSSWSIIATRAGSKQVRGWLESVYKLRIKSMSKKKWDKKLIRGWMETGKGFSAAEAVEAGLAGGIMTRAEFDKGVELIGW